MKNKHQILPHLFIIMLLLVSCTSIHSIQRLPLSKINQLVNSSRENVFRAFPELDQNEKNIIKSTQPQISYYKLAGDFAQYSVTWNIASNQIIRISGEGDVNTAQKMSMSLYVKNFKTGKYQIVESRESK